MFFQLGTSPLHFSAHYGHHQTAEVLLRSGISRDARTKVDRTPLHVAAQEGHASVVELLINNAADINSKDMVGLLGRVRHPYVLWCDIFGWLDLLPSSGELGMR